MWIASHRAGRLYTKLIDVIEHLFDPRAVLEATRRALKPGGLVVVGTPNFDALQSSHRHVDGQRAGERVGGCVERHRRNEVLARIEMKYVE